MNQIIIFDFDDTLIDNRLSDYQGFIIPCIELGIQPPSQKIIYKLRKEGLLAKDIVKQIIHDNNKKYQKEFLRKRQNFINDTKSNKYFRLKRNTRDLLKYLKNKNFTCVICSIRKNDEIIENFLVNKKLLEYFENIYLTNNLNSKIEINSVINRTIIKKKLIQEILKKYSNKNSEVIFIGNAEEDLNAAKSTKVKFIFYKNSYMPNNPKINLKNVNKIKTMKELQRMIEEEMK
jgi:phosphoglycolate phosphatase-like HAD superfamily hydrolase